MRSSMANRPTLLLSWLLRFWMPWIETFFLTIWSTGEPFNPMGCSLTRAGAPPSGLVKVECGWCAPKIARRGHWAGDP